MENIDTVLQKRYNYASATKTAHSVKLQAFFRYSGFLDIHVQDKKNTSYRLENPFLSTASIIPRPFE